MRWPGPSKYYYRGHYRMGNQAKEQKTRVSSFGDPASLL